jgi:hypothetical protein
MKLTKLTIQHYSNECEEWLNTREEDEIAKRAGKDSKSIFDRNCTTNLAMMDVWSVALRPEEKFVSLLHFFVLFTLL